MNGERDIPMPDKRGTTPVDKIQSDRKAMQLVEYRRKLRAPMRGGRR